MSSFGDLSAERTMRLPVLDLDPAQLRNALFRRKPPIPRYKPDGLEKSGPGTALTRELLDTLRDIWAINGGKAPFAFKLADGTTRHLDAGQLGFLFNRPNSEIAFDLDADGCIDAVIPAGVSRREDAPRVFATLAFGLEPEVWGAFGFASATVRNNLAQVATPRDRILIIGTQGTETAEAERGKLLGLIEVGRQAVQTVDLVEPHRWAQHLDEFGGIARWPYGMPIVSAELFDTPLPESRKVLPRVYANNLHMKLATNYEALTAEETTAVLALPRHRVADVWKSPTGSFAANLAGGKRPGPPPTRTPRLLTPSSGPAATYCLALTGNVADRVAEGILRRRSGWRVYKVGFSNNPVRRRGEITAFMPDEAKLGWDFVHTEWHRDEINAYGMEQEVFAQLKRAGAERFKGEMVAATESMLLEAWIAARVQAKRPTESVAIGPEHENYFLD
ncbi:MAG TPA: hypothetical protein VGL58_09215 [Caulobacteraceae bacterium]|jgi:hypothetical protein